MAKPALQGTHWVAVEISGRPLPAGEPLTLDIDEDGLFSGNSGCNRYRGGRRIAGDTLADGGPGISTRMACPDEARSQLEMEFQSILFNASAWAMKGDDLLILDPDGRSILFRAAPGPS